MTAFLNVSTSVTVYRCLTVLALSVTLSGCGGSDTPKGAGPGGPGGGPPMAMAVEAAPLVARPVERTTEYIATVKSRRSTNIQPQVEGFITRIVARPGQRVGRGALLMEVDSRGQQASVANLESVRAARDADVQWARTQSDRLKKLYDVGAVSQQEYEQATIAVQTAEAQLKAVDAQIQEQRVELGYFRVTAPMAGIVGDIPVRVGDRVTRTTELTTIDENAGLELYINVPVAQAAGLKQGMPVRIVDDAGKPVTTTAVNFIASSVAPETQAVLIKAPLEGNGPYRTDQFVRTHLVWSTLPGLTIPVVSVIRINGQYFAYVVDKGDGGTTIARQRPVQLGAVVGNDYVVLSGLKEGEQLIVSGIQKIGDGVPVKAMPPGSSGGPPPAEPTSGGR
jgi:RND family efflux transporter MFP subunit